MNKPGIILLGHPRSGTTLLRRLLNAHSAIAAPPETHLFSACARFLHHDTNTNGMDIGVAAGLSFIGVNDTQLKNDLRQFAFNYLNNFAQSKNKSRWLEKTAFDIFNLPTIEALCEDNVQYLGIIRHPLEVAISTQQFCQHAGTYPQVLHRYIKQHPQPLQAFAHSWADSTEQLLKLAEKRPEQTLICRYEDLTEQPDTVLNAILDHINEPIEPLQNKALNDFSDLGFSDHKTYKKQTITPKSPQWHTLPPHLIQTLRPRLNPLLEACGYEALTEENTPTTEQLRSQYQKGLFI